MNKIIKTIKALIRRKFFCFFNESTANILLGFKEDLIQKGILVDHSLNIQTIPLIRLFPNSLIKIGRNCTLCNTSSENIAGVNSSVVIATVTGQARLIIGNNVGISGAVICCSYSIKIGDYVNIGVNARIYDTDFHPIAYNERRMNPGFDLSKVCHGEVVIEDDVWIGANSIILKGVRIGKRTIIGAGSVVTKSFPDDCIVAGNPARIIRRFEV